MGDIPSPHTTPVQTVEYKANKIVPSGPASSPQKSPPAPAPAPASSRRRPSNPRQSSHGHTATQFDEHYDRRNGVPSLAGESGPFNMAPMLSACPRGGYQHPPPLGAHPQYSQQTSQPVMQHMPHNPYVGHHPGSIMVPGYYLQHPQMHQYYATNAPLTHHGPLPMQVQGSSAYYPVQFVMEHPQSLGYYPQPHQFPDPNHQRNDHMNRRYSQGHIPHEGRSQPRRPSYRSNKSFGDRNSPPDSKRQQQHTVRGPPRKPYQSGHAIWIGNLPPQTELMNLVHHVCELAPGLRSLFLISKSNCAFANFKEETTSIEAQKTIHESKFQSVRLVCRLRKNTAEPTSENHIVIASGTSIPTSPTLANDAYDGNISPLGEKADPLEGIETQAATKHTSTNAHRDRFFVLKSLTREDMEKSVKTGIWATQSHNEELLNNAFKTTDNVYLIFSANKSGEYFGFARMTSEINQDPGAAVQFAPQNQATEESDLPRAVSIDAKCKIPKGRIIDDSARGTMFWEVEENENDGEVEDDGEVTSNKETEDADEDLQTWGKPFKLQWLSIIPLPFYRTRGLRNPWNSNREVKIARDGTELEPAVGRRLIGLMNNNTHMGQHDSRGSPAFFASGGRR
ncbi:YT521-B-like splicing factor, putative [Cordyceps militaris CM01]|uniref:YT521-B-like splicing factor, putative n=1 Tax=Cordyceps militaris (strain CM01) TaxID=983644 RepID=G3JL26_CORMM|nr:YT521-B-like splicing factor, putative [Cordyceps militaris CM01]EGX90400.1 YT521-B-like splicing factor, putative [Cordyceps militaris CM01]